MRPQLPLKYAALALDALPTVGNHDAAPLDSHFLHAGQIFVSSKGESIVLILGSCVGVCIWDPIHAIGGATHYLLPSWDGTGVGSPRYGNVAISKLVQKLLEAGANRGELRAKVFGGGCLFDSMRESSSHKEQHLGTRNVEVALEVLTKVQIPVVSAELGVNRGQRIVFRTDTGKSLVGLL
jgi:chemotaxis protein CheD